MAALSIRGVRRERERPLSSSAFKHSAENGVRPSMCDDWHPAEPAGGGLLKAPRTNTQKEREELQEHNDSSSV